MSFLTYDNFRSTVDLSISQNYFSKDLTVFVVVLGNFDDHYDNYEDLFTIYVNFYTLSLYKLKIYDGFNIFE